MDFRFKAALTIVAILGVMFFYRMSHPSTMFAADGTDVDWDTAVQQSRNSHLPTVILFTAGWCPACRAFHGDVLSRDDVQSELRSHYNFYTVDLTHPSEKTQIHTQQLAVRYIQQMIRFDQNGKELDRINYLPADQLMSWLKAGE